MLSVARCEILATKTIRKDMWLFTSDPKIDHHQIVPIKYNMNLSQANVGHITDVCCISVIATTNLAEESLPYFKIFSEQETCDSIISTAGANF